MELLTHDMAALFAQLGLASDDISQQRFIRDHPIDRHTQLPDAPFWTPPQARFLREELTEDADWAELVDQLNLRLRA